MTGHRVGLQWSKLGFQESVWIFKVHLSLERLFRSPNLHFKLSIVHISLSGYDIIRCFFRNLLGLFGVNFPNWWWYNVLTVHHSLHLELLRLLRNLSAWLLTINKTRLETISLLKTFNLVVNHNLGRIHFANHFLLQLLLWFNNILNFFDICVNDLLLVLILVLILLVQSGFRVVSGPLIY